MGRQQHGADLEDPVDVHAGRGRLPFRYGAHGPVYEADSERGAQGGNVVSGPEMLIDSILHQRPRFDHGLFQMDAQTWAIHGYIPVDGEVILAEFDHRETA